jgi:hypothetical protein
MNGESACIRYSQALLHSSMTPTVLILAELARAVELPTLNGELGHSQLSGITDEDALQIARSHNFK